jgi:hypothetical protein
MVYPLGMGMGRYGYGNSVPTHFYPLLPTYPLPIFINLDLRISSESEEDATQIQYDITLSCIEDRVMVHYWTKSYEESGEMQSHRQKSLRILSATTVRSSSTFRAHQLVQL